MIFNNVDNAKILAFMKEYQKIKKKNNNDKLI